MEPSLKFQRTPFLALVVLDFSLSGMVSWPRRMSLSECLEPAAVDWHYYVPPIPKDALLAGISTRYALTPNDAAPDPEVFSRREFGSIQERMVITGGNLRWLFSEARLTRLRSYFGRAARELDFTMKADHYLYGDGAYHPVISCYSHEPYDRPGDLRYVSDYVREMVTTSLFHVRDRRVFDEALRAGSWLQRFLGFSHRRRTVRGWLFEDIAISLMCSHRCLLELTPCDRGTVSIKFPQGLKPCHGKFPASCDVEWLWTSRNPSFKGIDGVYCDTTNIFLLQMTISPKHKRLFIGHIGKQVQEWQKSGLKCVFVVVTDSRIHLNAFMKKKVATLVSNRWASIPTYIGIFVQDGVPVALTPTSMHCPPLDQVDTGEEEEEEEVEETEEEEMVEKETEEEEMVELEELEEDELPRGPMKSAVPHVPGDTAARGVKSAPKPAKPTGAAQAQPGQEGFVGPAVGGPSATRVQFEFPASSSFVNGV
jgi:hypothetical protein